MAKGRSSRGGKKAQKEKVETSQASRKDEAEAGPSRQGIKRTNESDLQESIKRMRAEETAKFQFEEDHASSDDDEDSKSSSSSTEEMTVAQMHDLIRKMWKRVKPMRGDMEEIKKMLAKLEAKLNVLAKASYAGPCIPGIPDKLPLKSQAELDCMEARILENHAPYVTYFGANQLIGNNYKTSGLGAILCDELMNDYNYRGIGGKKSFLVAGVKQSFAAGVDTEGESGAHEKSIRTQLQEAKNRHSTRKYRQNKAAAAAAVIAASQAAVENVGGAHQNNENAGQDEDFQNDE